jgi:hypothetical protein
LVFFSLSLIVPTPSIFWALSFSLQWALVFGLLNLVPLRLNNANSDGYKISQAIRGGPALDWVIRDLLIASSHATPLPPRDWPYDVILRLADAGADPQTRRYNCYIAYVHFLDRGDIRTAGQYLDRLTADWNAADPPEYALEAAYFHAFHGRGPAVAEKYLALATKDAEPWVRLRAQAAIDRASNNPKEAHESIDKALASLHAAPLCGAHQYEIDRLQELLPSAPQEIRIAS